MPHQLPKTECSLCAVFPWLIFLLVYVDGGCLATGMHSLPLPTIQSGEGSVCISAFTLHIMLSGEHVYTVVCSLLHIRYVPATTSNI